MYLSGYYENKVTTWVIERLYIHIYIEGEKSDLFVLVVSIVGV